MNNSTTSVPDQNNTDEGNGYYPANTILGGFAIAAAIALCFCLIGLVGNIIVFYYVCFKIKKNKFTIYIINLSVADSIFLIFSILELILFIIHIIQRKGLVYLILAIFCDSAQYSGMFILTGISLERCLSVLFPFWYQCRRPQNLSTIICVVVWLIGCFVGLIWNLVCPKGTFIIQTTQCTAVQIMVFALAIVICLPLMVISSCALLIKTKRNDSQQYAKKLYIIIVISVCVFIISVIPINFAWFLLYFNLLPFDSITAGFNFASTFCVVLNCTIDPYIYFVVGKKWKQKTKHSIQDALQRAFRADVENDDSKTNKLSNLSSQTNLSGTF